MVGWLLVTTNDTMHAILKATDSPPQRRACAVGSKEPPLTRNHTLVDYELLLTTPHAL